MIIITGYLRCIDCSIRVSQSLLCSSHHKYSSCNLILWVCLFYEIIVMQTVQSIHKPCVYYAGIMLNDLLPSADIIGRPSDYVHFVLIYHVGYLY